MLGIQSMKWDQYWVGPWTLFTSVLYITSYTSLMKKTVGFSFNHVFITSKKGYTYCYMPYDERKKFAQYIIDSIIKTGKLSGHIAHIKSLGDALCEMVAQLREKEFSSQEFKKFVQRFKEYNGPHITMRNTAEFLDLEKDAEAIFALREARVYTEKVYKATEDFMHFYGEKIATKTGYPEQLILAMLPDEMELYLSSGALPEKRVLEERNRHAAVLLVDENLELFINKQAGEMEKTVHGPTADELQGQMACGGCAKGTARVIFDPKNVTLFNRGDVLITGMTRPDFVPWMEKAVAIVTDGGGILSHAAIVAREMGKPCVIGTKSATRVFRDGDIVEVDADNGVVRKIK